MQTVLWSTLLGFALLVSLCTVTDIDLSLSGQFYDANHPQGWFLQETIPWSWLYRYGEYPAILMAVGAAVVLVVSFRQRSWMCYRRHCLILVLAVALGPGVLVNGLLKPFWGRPRPRQVMQFGGSQQYRPWWQPGGPGAGKSFPSGHTSMGYILIAGALPFSKRGWRWLVFSGGLVGGTLLGLTRIVQGGHFVTDALWAGVLMCGVVIVLQRTLMSGHEISQRP